MRTRLFAHATTRVLHRGSRRTNYTVVYVSAAAYSLPFSFAVQMEKGGGALSLRTVSRNPLNSNNKNAIAYLSSGTFRTYPRLIQGMIQSKGMGVTNDRNK